MCGIAGYIGQNPPSDSVISRCLGQMRRRGPDAIGSYRHDLHNDWHVCLLHSRLSIIDLNSRADQPMLRDRHALTFNGEIYNYVELRDALKRLGENFTTASDTEVLLAGLNRFGC